MNERWITHYSSAHGILLVGEGDFSFSMSLAIVFGSATNIVATSLDSYEELIEKYANARANVIILRNLGATVLHGVDATQMEDDPHLRWMKFDRIIYNFPHAGFHGKEDNPDVIMMHSNLVQGFLENACSMLHPDGEVHISHKTTGPFHRWGIEELASESSLICIGQDEFRMNDYPWYRNKRGSGWRSDEPFPLGACSTFKFKLCSQKLKAKKRKMRSKRKAKRKKLDLMPAASASDAWKASNGNDASFGQIHKQVPWNVTIITFWKFSWVRCYGPGR